jgi:hypothetical protein
MECCKKECFKEAVCVIGVRAFCRNREITRIVLNLPICEIHLKNARSQDLVSPALHQSLVRMFKVSGKLTFTVARVAFDDPDYLALLKQKN